MTDTDTNALKPCRYCGGPSVVIASGLEGLTSDEPFAGCTDCGASWPIRLAEQQNTNINAVEPAPEYYRDEPSLETSQSVIRRRAWRKAHPTKAPSPVAGDEAKIQLSIAISLKRIADTLDGTAAGINVGATIFGGVVNVDHRP